MKEKSLLGALKSFFTTFYYVCLFIIFAAICLAVFCGINWGISWAGCWLLYSQYPPPNMVNSFDAIPDHAQFGMPYVFGWMVAGLVLLCLTYAVALYIKYLKR